MNLVDKLLAVDAKVIMEKMTDKIEIKRLSKLVGEPFFITIQEISGKRYQELTTTAVDKKGNFDFDKSYQISTLLVLEGVTFPNLKDENLQKHFGAATPKDLAEILFQGGDMMKIADKITTISGFDSDADAEIKN
jgi:hypothetical protein